MNLLLSMKSPLIEEVCLSLSKGNSVICDEIWDAPKSHILSTFFSLYSRPILIITSRERETALRDDIAFFTGMEPLVLPSWELIQDDGVGASADIVGERLEVLQKIGSTKHPIVITSLQSSLEHFPSKKELSSTFQLLSIGSEVEFDQFSHKLVSLGYSRSSLVSDKGQFALRGGIIDFFPPGSFDPIRLEFDGDRIESIRSFDPISQKSIERKDSILLSPVSDTLFSADQRSYILDYLSESPLIVFDDMEALEDRFVALQSMVEYQKKGALTFKELIVKIASFPKIYFFTSLFETINPEKQAHLKKAEGKAIPSQFEMMGEHLSGLLYQLPYLPIDPEHSSSSFTHILISSSPHEKAVLEEAISVKGPIFSHEGSLSSGFELADIKVIFYPYSQLTGKAPRSRKKWRNVYSTPPSDFHELSPGDFVVHFHNGIGKFIGFETQKDHLGNTTEFMVIEYASGSRLFAPLSQAHLISRYIGPNETAPQLHALGTKTWHQAKVKAQKAIIGYAKDLLHLQASREVHGGFVFGEDSDLMIQFENDFPYEETPDQRTAIEAIKRDMTSAKAMDRLICGDVGYGKTEVAMRAAFKAVVDGAKQVAFLVPTTVLAMQHAESMKERMRGFPVKIALLTRFQKKSEQIKILEGVAAGTIDILIGTHRLIGKDVHFKSLGLVIIDEEQRFGVRAKEHLKKIKIGVDCLTLSATPIPRTLYFSLIGARDMSVISTPPTDRLPIKTILAERKEELIKPALLRELSQDGQAFFIHNRVESIYSVATDLQKWLPLAKISVVHGQMDGDEIDEKFHMFKAGLSDILVATTIVESGIDIPNANTIIIDRADQYGLADLYQLRGRVGRWNKPAFAYFLVPSKKELPEVARKRLNALIEASGYGGGMKLAIRDLEIRGAGDILGTQQSGNVSTIGFHLYCKLLKRAIETMKKELPYELTDTKIESIYPAQLPPSYIEETNIRIEIYHRLGDAIDMGMVDEILEELHDRFGPPPPEVQWLCAVTKIRIFASHNNITLVKIEKSSCSVEHSLKGKRELYLPSFSSPKHFESHVLALLQKIL